MIELNNIYKSYKEKVILNNISLKVNENEFVAVVGKSGCGKTTLLNIIGLLEKRDSGEIKVLNYINPKKKDIQKIRRNNIGYIFQNYALLEEESVLNNLKMAGKYNKDFNKDSMINALEEVGLTKDMLNRKVYELSGGEQQRIAIARILLKPCEIILADEPTGNLDDENKRGIVELMLKLKGLNKTIICVTHDKYIAQKSDRVISL